MKHVKQPPAKTPAAPRVIPVPSMPMQAPSGPMKPMNPPNMPERKKP